MIVGRRIVIRAPPRGSFSATMVPPSALTTWATIARPRPDPGRPAGRRRAVEAVEDVGQVLRGDARAVVADDDVPSRHSTETGSPGGLHLRALSSRLPTARRRPSSLATTQHGAASRSKRTSFERPCVFASATASSTSSSSRIGPGLEPVVVPAGQLGEVAHEVGELLHLCQHVVHQHLAVGGGELVDPADHLEVRAQAGERRAELVGGVEHQLALGLARGLEGAQQPVERPTEAPELVGSRPVRAARRRRSCRRGPRPRR